MAFHKKRQRYINPTLCTKETVSPSRGPKGLVALVLAGWPKSVALDLLGMAHDINDKL